MPDRGRKYLLSVILIIFISGCTFDHPAALLQQQFATLEDGKARLESLMQGKPTVFFFFAPDCPLCLNYSKNANELYQAYQDKGLAFIMVFPGKFYSNAEIAQFVLEYNVTFPVILDPEKELTGILDATVTPQAVVCDKNLEVIYSGAIDDWAYTEGRKKQFAEHQYLKDAMDAFLAEQKVSPSFVKPVGCIIE